MPFTSNSRQAAAPKTCFGQELVALQLVTQMKGRHVPAPDSPRRPAGDAPSRRERDKDDRPRACSARGCPAEHTCLPAASTWRVGPDASMLIRAPLRRFEYPRLLAKKKQQRGRSLSIRVRSDIFFPRSAAAAPARSRRWTAAVKRSPSSPVNSGVHRFMPASRPQRLIEQFRQLYAKHFASS